MTRTETARRSAREETQPQSRAVRTQAETQAAFIRTVEELEQSLSLAAAEQTAAAQKAQNEFERTLKQGLQLLKAASSEAQEAAERAHKAASGTRAFRWTVLSGATFLGLLTGAAAVLTFLLFRPEGLRVLWTLSQSLRGL